MLLETKGPRQQTKFDPQSGPKPQKAIKKLLKSVNRIENSTDSSHKIQFVTVVVESLTGDSKFK